MEDFLAPLMFVVVFLIIFSGYPVAFALGGASLLFAFIGVEMGIFDWNLLYAMPERIFGVMSNYVLLAVPFFIFMGLVLEKAKLAEDLLTTIGTLFGRHRGGLALGVVAWGPCWPRRRAWWAPRWWRWAASRCRSCCATSIRSGSRRV